MQQYLPLAVLKHVKTKALKIDLFVATVLTACGIETKGRLSFSEAFNYVATVLTACGIETVPP